MQWLADRGFGLADAAEFVRLGEASQKSKAALRTEKWRAKKEAENVTSDVTVTRTEVNEETSQNVTVTSPVTVPRERVLDKPLTKVLTGSVVVVDDASAMGAADDWPRDNLAKRLAAEVESPFLDLSKSQGLVLSGRLLDGWRKAGASWRHDVIPIVAALAAKNRKPINSWAYFEAAVLQSAADSRRALSLPQASPQTGPRQANERLPDQRQAARLDNYRAAFAGAEQASRNRAFSG
jgi:hypothetical protein